MIKKVINLCIPIAFLLTQGCNTPDTYLVGCWQLVSNETGYSVANSMCIENELLKEHYVGNSVESINEIVIKEDHFVVVDNDQTVYYEVNADTLRVWSDKISGKVTYIRVSNKFVS